MRRVEAMTMVENNSNNDIFGGAFMLLSEIRKNKRYTQQYVADKVGVEQSAVAMWEAGKSTPTMENLLKLAEVLELGLDELVASLPQCRN